METLCYEKTGAGDDFVAKIRIKRLSLFVQTYIIKKFIMAVTTLSRETKSNPFEST